MLLIRRHGGRPRPSAPLDPPLELMLTELEASCYEELISNDPITIDLVEKRGRMRSSASDPSSDLKGEPTYKRHSSLISNITALKDKIQMERMMDIQGRVAKNAMKLASHIDGIVSATALGDSHASSSGITCLSNETAKCIIIGYTPGTADKDREKDLDEFFSSSTKLPHMEKIPHYITWIFLQRNQRMTEDQSVMGKRRIYYAENEALICSDSEEDNPEPEEEKFEFSEGEDRILWLAFEQYGVNDEVIEVIKEFVGGTSLQMQERYIELKEISQGRHQENSSGGFLEKRLSDALDSFDTLFCRRCLVFDCRLHGCSQPLIFPSDKQPIWSDPESGSTPCSEKCHLKQQMREIEGDCNWKALEKDLLLKGLEIFGNNSCLIARNLLSGLKTCLEVNDYLHSNLALAPSELDAIENLSCEDNRGASSQTKDQEIHARPRSFRRKGNAQRRKYSLNPTAAKKRNNNGLDRKQYTPCSCQPTCGRDCPCLEMDNCCEKYCGCSRSCKNRFRGCHCAKSQCRSQKCPCFASGRECDPDVCRNCWVSCGDGSLGEPPKQGDGQCGNMRILLRQQQRILLGKSDVTGWGAFIQNSANKNDYLGEYTGELISQDEAERRGKIYDRLDSSFLFNLNDEWCIDACRKGDKLKFANHSSKPNCHCQILRVGGEDRVGIFAKERLAPRQELFYDYSYGNTGPLWARDPKEAKKDEASTSKGRAKKHQS